ncbi:MAG: aldehyde dehydrogenase family protein, partial [Paraburkholderia sp.]|uniref:aldehyde dehydrogenase family protein n=1 Tax=Paraburkholderia sp. TaxID=1926495 RepID=UPI003C6B2C2F
VHTSIYDEFLKRLAAYTATMSVGDPRRRDIRMGPLNNSDAFATWKSAVEEAKRVGKVYFGAEILAEGIMQRGDYVTPTIVTDLPDGHHLLSEETFLPFLAVRKYDDLKVAIAEGNAVKYGLTSAFYGYGEELDYYLDHAESGLLFSNRRTGATTGAWPGYQSFPGWKGSGLTGKGGFGPSDLQQFMREQSLTLMREQE